MSDLERPEGKVDQLLGLDYAGYLPIMEKARDHLLLLWSHFGTELGPTQGPDLLLQLCLMVPLQVEEIAVEGGLSILELCVVLHTPHQSPLQEVVEDEGGDDAAHPGHSKTQQAHDI